MIDHILRPLGEGFRDAVKLWKDIILALLSVFVVLWNFVNAPPRSSEGDSTVTDRTLR